MQIRNLTGTEPLVSFHVEAPSFGSQDTDARSLLSADHAAGPPGGDAELREAFDEFVGESFFGQMLAAMRKTTGKPAYFHGGRAEEVFQSQLDQMLSQEMAAASASTFSGPMFESFMLHRR